MHLQFRGPAVVQTLIDAAVRELDAPRSCLSAAYSNDTVRRRHISVILGPLLIHQYCYMPPGMRHEQWDILMQGPSMDIVYAEKKSVVRHMGIYNSSGRPLQTHPALYDLGHLLHPKTCTP